MSEKFDWCEKHGDLSTPNSTGGVTLQQDGKKLGDLCCPKCFCEWAAEMFPVQSRERGEGS